MLNMTGLASMFDINQLTEMLSGLTLGNEPSPLPEDHTKEIIAGVVTLTALAVTCCCVSQRMWARRQMNHMNYLGAAAHIEVDCTPRATISDMAADAYSSASFTGPSSSSATSSMGISFSEQPLVDRSAIVNKCKKLGFSFTDAQVTQLQEKSFAHQFLELKDDIKGCLLFVCQLARTSHQGDELSLLKYAMDLCDALKALLGALPTEDLLHKILPLRKAMSEDDFLKALQDSNGQMANSIKTIVATHQRAMEEQAKADRALADQRAQQTQARAAKAKAEATRRAQEEERARQQAAREEQERQWKRDEARAEALAAQRREQRAREEQARADAEATRAREAQAARDQAARAEAATRAREHEQSIARVREQEQAAARAREARLRAEAEAARAAQVLREQAARVREQEQAAARASEEAKRHVKQPASREDLKSKLGAMLAQPPGAAIDPRAAAARQQQSLHMSGRAQQRVEVSDSVGEVATSAKNATLKKK